MNKEQLALDAGVYPAQMHRYSVRELKQMAKQ